MKIANRVLLSYVIRRMRLVFCKTRNIYIMKFVPSRGQISLRSEPVYDKGSIKCF